MAALLGNFLLPESDLQDLYRKLNLTKVTTENQESLQNYRLATANSMIPGFEGFDGNLLKNNDSSKFNGIANGSISSSKTSTSNSTGNRVNLMVGSDGSNTSIASLPMGSFPAKNT
ncbi:hypothetical protein NQ317_008078, partial [Molorchus minor]